MCGIARTGRGAGEYVSIHDVAAVAEFAAAHVERQYHDDGYRCEHVAGAKTMKRNPLRRNPRQIVRDRPDLWRTNPWLCAHETGADHGDRIDETDEVQYSAAETPQTQERQHSEGTNDLRAALNVWEDEGGRMAAGAKAVTVH